MRLKPLPLLAAGFALTALAACSDSFTDSYTRTALSANPPDPEKQVDEDLHRTGEQELRGVDTTQLQALE